MLGICALRRRARLYRSVQRLNRRSLFRKFPQGVGLDLHGLGKFPGLGDDPLRRLGQPHGGDPELAGDRRGAAWILPTQDILWRITRQP